MRLANSAREKGPVRSRTWHSSRSVELLTRGTDRPVHRVRERWFLPSGRHLGDHGGRRRAGSRFSSLSGRVSFLGIGGALLPIAELNAEAKRGRRHAKRVICSFLDLVVLGLAGGMGIESALLTAAQLGENVVSRRLLAALSLCRDTGEPPWEALARLGETLGIDELSELAATAGLAGMEGAKVRDHTGSAGRVHSTSRARERRGRGERADREAVHPGRISARGFPHLHRLSGFHPDRFRLLIDGAGHDESRAE